MLAVRGVKRTKKEQLKFEEKLRESKIKRAKEAGISIASPNQIEEARRIYKEIPFGAYYFSHHNTNESSWTGISLRKCEDISFEDGQGPGYYSFPIWARDPSIDISWGIGGEHRSVIYTFMNHSLGFRERDGFRVMNWKEVSDTLGHIYRYKLKQAKLSEFSFGFQESFYDSNNLTSVIGIKTINNLRGFVSRFLNGVEPQFPKQNYCAALDNIELLQKIFLPETKY